MFVFKFEFHAKKVQRKKIKKKQKKNMRKKESGKRKEEKSGQFLNLFTN